MAERGAENACFLVTEFVRPDNAGMVLARLVTCILLALCKRSRGRPVFEVTLDAMHIVVKLFVDRRPIFKAFGDRMIFVGVCHLNRLLWAVTAGLQTEHVEP